MGSALIRGALDSGIIKADRVSAYDIRKEALTKICRENKIRAASSNIDAVEKSDFIFICVKPQQMKKLLLEIRESLRSKQCLISIAAGVRTHEIEAFFPVHLPLIRVMPNTPALIRCGVTAITQGRFASRLHLQFAIDFFSAVGKVVVLPEKHFDAVTAISGSGPAYIFYLAESFQRACKMLGLPRSASEILFKQTLVGSGKMLMNSVSPTELRQSVTSPGGTTESAIRYLESKSWLETFIQAIKKARDRSKELKIK